MQLYLKAPGPIPIDVGRDNNARGARGDGRQLVLHKSDNGRVQRARMAGNITGDGLKAALQGRGFATDGLSQAGIIAQIRATIGIDGTWFTAAEMLLSKVDNELCRSPASTEKSMASIRRSSRASRCSAHPLGRSAS